MQDTTALLDRPSAASPASVDAATRADLYAPIHKALRHFMSDTLHRLGVLDVDDATEMREALGQLDALLGVMRGHLEHENAFVHPAIEARAPRTSDRVALDHVEHGHAIDALREEAEALREAPPARRALLALRLYRHFALFVAENLQHMHHEETVHNAALWAHYSDAELHALHERLLASLTPAEMMEVARWMLPALPPAERAGLMLGLRAQLPAPAFDGLHRAVAARLDDVARGKLERALNAEAAR